MRLRFVVRKAYAFVLLTCILIENCTRGVSGVNSSKQISCKSPGVQQCQSLSCMCREKNRIFTNMAEKSVKFVQLIEIHQCLYNSTLQDYSRKDVTEKAWAEISRTMDWTVADCKEKWKNIRNGFVRSLKPSPSGSSSKTKKLYYLHDVMQFVLPYVKPVQHLENTGNIVQTEINKDQIIQSDEDDCETSANDSQTNTEQHNDKTSQRQDKHRQKTLIGVNKKAGKKRFRKETDDVDIAVLQYVNDKRENKKTSDDKQMFLLSLLPDVSKLSERNLRQFKIKTLTLLEDMLTQQEQITIFSHPQTTMDPLTWSGSTSRASYTSPPGPSPTFTSTSPQYTPNQLRYELTDLQDRSQSAIATNTNMYSENTSTFLRGDQFSET